jgi:tetratricopeptide (TPR) repeat protein
LGRDWLFGLALVLAVALAYQSVWHAGFIWDDDDHVTANPCIVGPLGLKEIWTTSAARYYPLVLTTFWLEHALWGLNPSLFHLVNILSQGACAVVLWRVLLSLRVPGAWLGAALWALHPVQVGTVAWITELKNTQSALFYLLAILFFVKSLRTKEGVPAEGRRDYALTLLFAALAMLSKSSTVVLPLVLCLCAWWVEGRWRWQTLKKTAPFFLMAVATAILALKSVQIYGVDQSPEAARSLSERLITSGDVFWFYLGKLLWPHPLIFIYPRWDIQASLWLSYLPLLGAVVFMTVLWLKRDSWSRPYFFALAYFVVALLPVLGLVNHYFLRYSFVSDHLQYLAGMGPLALAGAGLARLGDFVLPGKNWLQGILCAGLLVALGTLTWQRGTVYVDEETLWNDTLAQNPTCWMAHDNLGPIYLRNGQADAALSQYQQALEIRPDDVVAHYNMAQALLQKGQLDAAIAEYRRAIEIQPNFVMAYTNLGWALAQSGRVEDGIAQFQKALGINPHFALAHYYLGLTLGHKGSTDEMIAQLREAVADNPGMAEAHYNLGLALFQKGQPDAAIEQYREALETNPLSADTHNNLGLALYQDGRIDEALGQLEAAVQLAPGLAAAHYNLGNALLQKGLLSDAIAEYRKTLAADPHYAEAHNNLAVALFQSGQLNEAIAEFRDFARLNPGDVNAQKNLAKAEAMARQAQGPK